MVTLPTVSSFFSTCGCFLRGGRSPFGDLPPLSLAFGWPPGANGSPPCEWRHLQGFRVEDPSGVRKGGPNRPPSGLGWPAWADRPRPTSARFRRPFAPMDPHAFMHFAPSTCTILTMSSSRPRWRFSLHEVRSFTLQSPGVFLRIDGHLARSTAARPEARDFGRTQARHGLSFTVPRLARPV
jgi:hypothetical protein